MAVKLLPVAELDDVSHLAIRDDSESVRDRRSIIALGDAARGRSLDQTFTPWVACARDTQPRTLPSVTVANLSLTDGHSIALGDAARGRSFDQTLHSVSGNEYILFPIIEFSFQL